MTGKHAPAIATARPYTWDRGKTTQEPGVMINARTGGYVFIPWDQIRQLADQLHDLTDRHEQRHQQTKGRN